MNSNATITSMRFTNFKSLRNYSVALYETNVLVGPNNAGKSTIISALRILEIALRRARSRNADRVRLPGDAIGYGHNLQLGQVSVSLENVATDYNSEDSRIDFHLSNQNRLSLYFPSSGGCTLHWDNAGPPVTTASRFRSEFPVVVRVVPVLGPLEHNETYVNETTVRESLATHRASRHFRNYWHYFPGGWDQFAAMIASTWAGMTIKKPELDIRTRQLSMFVSEDRIDREIYWAGFGFQIWCQLLTHISRAADATILAIDEPEIYLHPDVQRQLLGILRPLPASVLLSTHSVEIIGEADPDEILLVQKGKPSAQRLRDVEGMQSAISLIGSAQNLALAHLARTKKIVLVADERDFMIVRRFAKALGLDELAAGVGLTAFASGGLSSRKEMKSFAKGVRCTIDSHMKIFAVYAENRPCGEISTETRSAREQDAPGVQASYQRELENHLLNVDVLQRVAEKQLSLKNRRQAVSSVMLKTIKQYLDEITENERCDAQSRYLSKVSGHEPRSGKEEGTFCDGVLHEFERRWESMQERLLMVSGKSVLRALQDALRSDLGISLTEVQIIDGFRQEEIPVDLKTLITKLEAFRTS